MVQFSKLSPSMQRHSSALAFVAVVLVVSANMDLVLARDDRQGLTGRDLVDHEVIGRDLLESDDAALFSREEIEWLFGRDSIDTADLDTVFRREDLDTLKSAFVRDVGTQREGVEARHHPQPHATNFFQAIGDFVKRCAHGYWQHMIRKTQIILGKCHDDKDELDFLPRSPTDEDAADMMLTAKRSWAGEILRSFRDASLSGTKPPDGSAPTPDAHLNQPRAAPDDGVTYWERGLDDNASALWERELDDASIHWDRALDSPSPSTSSVHWGRHLDDGEAPSYWDRRDLFDLEDEYEERGWDDRWDMDELD